MARPTMRAAELGAAPQMALPISKMTRAVKYTHLMLKKVYSFPKKSWNAQVVRRYAEPYQPTWSIDLN